MKKILFTSIFIIAAILSYSQVPNGFNYQAMLRNSSGDIIADESVDIEISIIDENSGGTVLYTETHTKSTNAYGLVNLVIGSETPDYGVFADINWAVNDKFISIKVDATDMGTFQLLTVPFAMHAASATNLGSENVYTGTDTLFVVKDTEGNPVFVVFPDGAKVIVDEVAKGRVGGFAVSGRSPTKADETDIFIVTPDSTRIFVNDTIQSKGRVGGFAVSGRSPTKGISKEYLVVTQDSTRVYVSDTTLAKGRVGGFAVSGRSPTKAGVKDYFNISGNQNADSIMNEARIMWYPKKSALLAGEVHVGSPDSVGTNSTALGYRTIAMGDQSQAFGYKAQALNSLTTAIGKYATAEGESSYAFGDGAKSIGQESYAIGSGSEAIGLRSFALGSVGVDSIGDATDNTKAIGDYSFAIGLGSVSSGLGSFAFGVQDTATSNYSIAMGYQTKADNWYATSIGYKTLASGYNSFATGAETQATNSYSVAMGRGTTASGFNATAIGSYTTASERFTTAMGERTTASGMVSTAMGGFTKAEGNHSTAMGSYTTASGQFSAAIGYLNTASGISSIALGERNNAIGDYSTSTGYSTTAEGNVSTAMGRGTKAIGHYSIGGGWYPIVRGTASISVGSYTIARTRNEAVFGRYNDTTSSVNYQVWNASDPLFIIGNGSADDARHNAVFIKKNGEVYFPDVYSDEVGATNIELYIDDEGKIGHIASSKRYKSDIVDMEDLSWLYNLRPVNFIYKNDEANLKQYGLIAEEVELVNPLFVSYNEKGEVETVSYNKLITPMLKVIKVQKSDLKVLKSEIKDQKTIIENQENKISELEKRLSEIEKFLQKSN